MEAGKDEGQELRQQLRQGLRDAARDLQAMLKSPVHFSHLRCCSDTDLQYEHQRHLEIVGRRAGALLEALKTTDAEENKRLYDDIFNELGEVIEQRLTSCLEQGVSAGEHTWECRLSVPQRSVVAELKLHFHAS